MEAGSFLFSAIKNHRPFRYNVRFGELLLCNCTSDCLEMLEWHPGVVDCQSELNCSVEHEVLF